MPYIFFAESPTEGVRYALPRQMLDEEVAFLPMGSLLTTETDGSQYVTGLPENGVEG